MSRRTAWKLCSQAGILSSAQRRRRGKGKKAGPPVFDDHVQQVFRADSPNRLWLTDITEHRTSEGKLYCCAIKDVFSNRIVGYSISDRMTAKLAVDAVRNAVARRGEVAGCILHADRGSQFRSRAMVRELRRHDMVGSMGRVGAAGDNAAMESFWSLLQTNVLNQQRWTTRQELQLAMVVWIDRTTADGDRTVVSSRILRTEITRVLRRESIPVSRRDVLLDVLGLIPLSAGVLAAAEAIEPHAKTLDAIHLGTVIATGLDATVVTHDAGMASAAASLGYPTIDPVTE